MDLGAMMKMTFAIITLSTLLSAGDALRFGASANDRSVSDREHALRIAKDRGMSQIGSAELDGGVWEVKGRNSSGVFLEVRISANDGKIIGIDYGHPSPMRLKRQAN